MTVPNRRPPDGGLFHASFSLGRVAGVPIGVNWSWLLVLVLVTWSLGAAVFPEQNPGLSDVTYGVMASIAAVLFFACLLLHELGHATIARREHMAIDGITLWVFGGASPASRGCSRQLGRSSGSRSRDHSSASPSASA